MRGKGGGAGSVTSEDQLSMTFFPSLCGALKVCSVNGFILLVGGVLRLFEMPFVGSSRA